MAFDGKPSDSSQRYWAFISYSQHDAAWATRLHERLERYRVPRSLVGRRAGDHVIPRRLIPVFRDRSELASAANLAQEIRDALQSSDSLIVVCSPHAAASKWVEEEIRTFKALGREERIFPLVVDGEPSVADGHSASLECFPPSLRFDVRPDGTQTKRLTEPIAADAREGKDGWTDACLKLIAGILHVRFDELRRRERTRQRHRRNLFALAGIGAILAIGLAYLALADADFAVWGDAQLQRQIDRCGCSVFRRVPSAAALSQSIEVLRHGVRRDLLAAIADGRVRWRNERSVWETAQVSAALLRDPGLTPEDYRLVAPMLDSVFSEDGFQFRDGKRVGWRDSDFWPRAEAVLWTVMALSAALQRPDLISDAERQRFSKYLGTVQDMAESYYPLGNGGWNMVPFGEPTEHFIHTTALALHALLQLHSAGSCWRGDCDRLTRMITDTVGLLTQAFVDDGGVAGWRRQLDDTLPVVSDLSILVSGVLVRAHIEVGVPLSDRVAAAALQQLARLRHRFYHPSYQEISKGTLFTSSDGRTQPVVFTVRVMLYPWAIEALVNSLRYAQRTDYPPETRRALERSLGHILVTLAPAMLADMTTAPKWVEGEVAYGIGAVRREDLARWLR